MLVQVKRIICDYTIKIIVPTIHPVYFNHIESGNKNDFIAISEMDENKPSANYIGFKV